MAFQINDFLAALNNNGDRATADKFDVYLKIPSALSTLSKNYNQLYLMCEGAELPGADITPIEYRHYGFIQRIPHHYTFYPLTLTFYCTGYMFEKRFFDAWLNLLIDKKSGLLNYRLDSGGSPNYETNIFINQYAQDGTPSYWALFEDALPVSISQMNTNWGDDSTHRLTVQFLFTKWFNGDETNQSDPGLATNFSSTGSPLISNFANQLLGGTFNNITRTINNPNNLEAALMNPNQFGSQMLNALKAQKSKTLNPYEIGSEIFPTVQKFI
jgi:hypothetical protein